MAGGLNLYGYANGDPVNFSDPFGLCPEDVDITECPEASGGVGEAMGPVEALGLVVGGGFAVKGLLAGVRGLARRLFATGADEVASAVRNAGNYTSGQLRAFERQLSEHGRSAVERSQRRLQRRLDAHVEKLEEIRAAGGHTSSVEREIRNFRGQLEAIEEVLNRFRRIRECLHHEP